MKMIMLVLGVTMLLCFGVSFTPSCADADTNISINIGAPPPPPLFSFPKPPDLVVVPQGYVYFVPDIGPDIFFYRDYWYRLHNGHYYRASHYNGPWKYWEKDRIPSYIINLPPGYRKIPPGHTRIPYGQAKKSWRQWEQEKHWDRHEEKERRKENHERSGKSKGKNKH